MAVVRTSGAGATSLQQSVLGALALLTPLLVPGTPKVRIGSAFDGGYVMLDDFPPQPLCYSIGIGGDVSWDSQLAERGGTIYMYDHTIPQPPLENPAFRFSSVGLSATDKPTEGTLSLDTMLALNDHTSQEDLILKIDIEGAEWDVLPALHRSTLERFRQIVIELHGLGALVQPDYRSRFTKGLLNVRATHLPVHVHGNNWGDYVIAEGVPVPDVLELTFARRSTYIFAENNQTFPTSLDRPCHPNRPDFYLGTFSFLCP